jgi:hypothetical protein
VMVLKPGVTELQNELIAVNDEHAALPKSDAAEVVGLARMSPTLEQGS